MSPIIAGILEVVSQCLYDEIKLDPSPRNLRYSFFEVPVGGRDDDSDPIKTFLQTNLYDPGALPVPNRFIATRLNALYLHDSVPVRLHETNLYGKTLITFLVNQKVYWEGPAWLCASPFALLGTPKDELPRLKQDYGIEWERIGATLQMPANDVAPDGYKGGVIIDRQQRFEVTANIDADSSQGLDLAIHLDGNLLRAVM